MLSRRRSVGNVVRILLAIFAAALFSGCRSLYFQHPQSATVLYPTVAGLAPGSEFRYSVYSGELQKIAEVRQRIAAFERSTLFAGEGYRIETELEGYRVDTWLSPGGAPLLEIGMNGVLISELEDEARARAYLANASLNKSEALVEFAIVRPEKPIARPRAREIAGNASDPREQVQRIVAWIDGNIVKSPADAWTALDVLATREVECQGHTYLYAALARALRIPTRVVNGIVYSDEFGGFLYHTWAESLVGGRWLAIDPTFATVPADATHVKLVEGETPADLAPLVDWVGRLKLRVIAIEGGD